MLPQLAAKEIPEVFAYDYQTVERSLADAYPLLTPEYRQEFQKSANAQIIPEAKKREVVVQANVVGVGVMSAKRNSASVMVYLNRTVTDKSRQPIYDGSRLRVDFKRIGGQMVDRLHHADLCRPRQLTRAGQHSEAHRNVVALQRITLDRAGRGTDELQ